MRTPKRPETTTYFSGTPTGKKSLRRNQQVPAGVKEGLEKEFTAARSDFLKGAPQVTPLLERAREEHRRLHDDTAVKAALAAINRSTKTRVSLPRREIFSTRLT